MLFNYSIIRPHLRWGFENKIIKENLGIYMPVVAFEGIGRVAV